MGPIPVRPSARSAARRTSRPSGHARSPWPRSADPCLHGRERRTRQPHRRAVDASTGRIRSPYSESTLSSHAARTLANAGSRGPCLAIPRSISATDTTLRYRSVVRDHHDGGPAASGDSLWFPCHRGGDDGAESVLRILQRPCTRGASRRPPEVSSPDAVGLPATAAPTATRSRGDLTLLDKMDVPMDNLGDSTGRLRELSELS